MPSAYTPPSLLNRMQCGRLMFPYNGSTGDHYAELFERIEAFATSIGQHDKESSEEFKLTTVQLWGGLFLLWLFLPVPVPFGIVKGMLGLVFIPFMPIIWVLRRA